MKVSYSKKRLGGAGGGSGTKALTTKQLYCYLSKSRTGKGMEETSGTHIPD